MTPEQFHKQYMGWGRDVDGVAGVQCVDLFKEFLRIIGVSNYSSPIGGDGYADNIWFNRSRWSQWLDQVSRGQFQNGDIILFPHSRRGGTTHPSSHVCFYFNGLEFGTNQSADRKACDKATKWTDALGGLRWKGWEKMGLKNGFSEFEANGVKCSIYKGKHIGLIVPDKPMQLKDMDADVNILSKCGNDLFEMSGTSANAAGQIFGPYSSIDHKKSGQPSDSKNYLFFMVDGDDKLTYGDWNGVYRDPSEIKFLCSPQSIFSDSGIKYALYRGSASYTASWYWAYIVHFSDGTFGNGVSKGAVQPKYIWNALKALGADVVAFMDGGSGGIGSSQQLYWDGSKMTAYQSSGRAVADIAVIYNTEVSNTPDPEPQKPADSDDSKTDDYRSMYEEKCSELTALETKYTDLQKINEENKNAVLELKKKYDSAIGSAIEILKAVDN